MMAGCCVFEAVSKYQTCGRVSARAGELPPDTSVDSVRRKLVLDRSYIDSAGLRLDAHIMLCTVLLVFGVRRSLSADDWERLSKA